jgi:hypothetical protein
MPFVTPRKSRSRTRLLLGAFLAVLVAVVLIRGIANRGGAEEDRAVAEAADGGETDLTAPSAAEVGVIDEEAATVPPEAPAAEGPAAP